MLSSLHKLIRGHARDPEARLASANLEIARGWSLKAFEAIHSLAQSGHAGSQYRLGQIYEAAEGVVQNLADAVHWYRKAAIQGHSLAQARLGLIYFIDPPEAAGLVGNESETRADWTRGHGSKRYSPDSNRRTLLGKSFFESFPYGFSVKQDFGEAAKWNRLAADAGIPEAQARIGHQLASGLGVRADPAAAVRYFHAAALQEDSAGQTGLGILLAGGYGGTPRYSAASQWLQRAAANGNSTAQYWLGQLLLESSRGLSESDTGAALRLLREAARQGQVEAMYRLGLAHWRGEGGLSDPNAAESWFRRAASRGVVEAMRALGQMLLERPEHDGVEAATWLRQAAEFHDRRAAALLAELHLQDRGVPLDLVEAARWLGVAGEEARPEAHALLAACYAKGLGAKPNYSFAASWLRGPAIRGSVSAQYNLGSLHRQGKGVSKDPILAADWFRKAAAGGDTQAAFYLGLLLAEEKSPIQDLAQAASWFRVGVRGGHGIALCNLALLMMQGRGLPPNVPRALRLLEDGASAGSVDAAEILVDVYTNGQYIVPDPHHVARLIETAVSLGSTSAAIAAAREIMNGSTWKQDPAKILSILKSSANAGETASQRTLGQFLEFHSGESSSTLESAEAWIAAAAEGGDPVAQSSLADSARRGRSGPPDPAKAEKWYRKSAAQGHVPAVIELARLLETGSERTAPTECFGLWLMAASNGSGLAQRKVGQYYLDGVGCEKSDEAGARWIQAAANSGDKEAQYLLGCCYRDGIGVAKDETMARAWLERAAFHDGGVQIGTSATE